MKLYWASPTILSPTNLGSVSETLNQILTYLIYLVGIASIGMIIGSVLAAPLSDRVGRKMGCILGIGVTYIISYVLFVIPVNMDLLYISRLMMGVGLGVSQSISTIYIAEISTPETRGSLAVIPSMTGCLGVNACQVIMSFD